MIGKSTLHKPGALFWTTLALSACATLVTLFITTRLQIGSRMSGSFTRLGANGVITLNPKSGDLSSEERQSAWTGLQQVANSQKVPLALLHLRVGLVDGLPVGVVMNPTDKLRFLVPYWQVTGRYPATQADCLVGNRVAERLKLKLGDEVKISWHTGQPARVFRATGLLTSGDDDESRIFVGGPLEAKTTNETALPGTSVGETGGSFDDVAFIYGLLAVPGGAKGIERFQSLLDQRTGGFMIRPARQIVYGEQVILAKVELLSGITLIAVFALTCLGLSAAVLARTLERSREISLMRALGAKRRWVAGLLIAESACLGLFASLVGFGAGTILAREIGRQVFQASFSPELPALTATALSTLAVAMVGAALGIRHAIQLQPAILLRSE